MPDLEPTPQAPPPPQPTANGAAGHGSAPGPKPKGLLPVPPEVVAAVDEYVQKLKDTHGYAATPERRHQITQDYTLQWHYGGDVVVMRETPQGYEVLASGDDVWDYVRETPPEQNQDVVIHNPAVWNGVQLPRFIEVR